MFPCKYCTSATCGPAQPVSMEDNSYDNPHGDFCVLAMQAALGILGMRCYHSKLWVSSNLGDTEMWNEALDAKYYGKGRPYGRREFDQILHDFHAVSDVGALAFVPELLEAYPEAKVLLVERDVESWYKSFERNNIRAIWDPFTRAVSHLDRWTLSPIRATMDRWVQGCLDCHSADEMREKARDIYRGHYALVRELTPKGRLLEFRLDQGWEPLCKFLDVPVPDEPFPRLNETAWFEEKVRLLVRRGIRTVLIKAVLYGAPVVVALGLVYQRFRT